MNELPKEIWVKSDSNYTGTYCDVDDGGDHYIRKEVSDVETRKRVEARRLWKLLLGVAVEREVFNTGTGEMDKVFLHENLNIPLETAKFIEESLT